MREKSEITSILPIFSLYFIPILAWILYTHHTLPLSAGWLVALVGFLILFFGTSLLFVFVRSLSFTTVTTPAPIEKEVKIIEQVFQDNSHEYLSKIDELETLLEQKNDQIEQRTREMEHFLKDQQNAKEGFHAQFQELISKEEQARQRIEELEIEAHQKQLGIQQLENQIHDLRYEIKTLLHLTEVDYGQIGIDIPTKEELHFDLEDPLLGPVVTEDAGERLLKRCLHIAEKMTPGYKASNLRSLSTDPYAFDLRRLSDSLRLETGALIVLYSPKEKKVQFANKEAKTLLGWSSDKFTQDFHEILGDDLSLFEKGLAELSTHLRASFLLHFRAKNHSIIPLQGLMGTISSGIFRSLAIAIFYKG